MIYAGVGSRETPPEIMNLMNSIAGIGFKNDHILRTGDADGADKAFRDYTSRRVVYTANCFYFGSKRMEYEQENWDKADLLIQQVMDDGHYRNVTRKPYVHRLHMRNTFQVLGVNHDVPASMVICWTPKGQDVGGTRTAILVARMNDIPVHNLGLIENETIARRAVEDGRFPFLEE